MPNAQGSLPARQECEILRVLFDGPSGTAKLGRLVVGGEAGRLVLLRQIAERHLAARGGLRGASSVGVASRVAHPNLMKVLGLVEVKGAPHVASEFIAGVPLLQVAAARKRESPLDASVCLKVVYDALLAASAAKRLLRTAGISAVPRIIFSDTVWVAEFGETLLTEAGLSRLLHGAKQGEPASRPAPDQDPDVAAAGAELRRLFTYRDGKLAVPVPFRDVVVSILARSEAPKANRFESVEEMARALEALPVGCLATEGEVGCAIRSLMRPELDKQRAHMSTHERIQPEAVGDEPTSVFSPEQLLKQSERVTERPPAPGREVPEVAKIPPPPLAPDAETRLMFLDRKRNEPKQNERGEEAAEVAKVAMGSASDETQIFIPVFRRVGSSQPPGSSGARAEMAPVASVLLYQDEHGPAGPSLTRRSSRPLAKTNKPPNVSPWLGAILVVLALLVLTVLVAGAH